MPATTTQIYQSLALNPEKTHKRKAPDEFTFRTENHVPSDLCLADEVIVNLKNKQYMDPISRDEINIYKITRFACVQVQGIYQIYIEEDLRNHIKATGALNNRNTEFRDINTNEHVRTNTVFTLTPDRLYNFFFTQEYETEPPTKTRKKSR